MKLWTAILFLLLCSGAWAGGGSSIGNGAGLAEQNFIYAFQSLPKAIGQCLILPTCVQNEDPRLLREIGELAQDLLDQARPEEPILQFVSAAEKPGFFDTAPGQPHRIAKTDLFRGAKVFVNVDQLYTDLGQPTLDLATISAILVHEFGHQTGEVDHRKLDRLAARVRGALAGRLMTYQFRGGALEAELTVANYAGRLIPMDMLLRTPGESTPELRSIGELITSRPLCSSGVGAPLSWQLENGHWLRPRDTRVLPFQAWLTVECLTASRTVRREIYDVDLRLKFAPGENGKMIYESAEVSMVPSIRPEFVGFSHGRN